MKRLLLIPAAACLILSFAIPGGWYEELPWPEDFTRPAISGLLLFRICLAIDGVLLAAIGLFGGDFRSEGLGGLFPEPDEEAGRDIEGGAFAFLITGVVLLGLITRFYRLGTGLWIDEIVTVLMYGQRSFVELFSLTTNLNNHLLNTMLMKLSMAAFGESDWSIRLPAAVAGVATVPAVYWVSRFALSRRWGLAASLLFALSYHHIFFSQNARGYSPHILFSLLSTGFLLKAIKEDRLLVWVLFVTTTVLNFVSHLNAAFVVTGHAIMCVMMLVVYRKSISPTGPLARHGVAAFALAGYLGFHVYAMILPNAFAFVTGSYGLPMGSYWTYLAGKVGQVISGVTGGVGAVAWLGLAPAMALGIWGLVNLWRKNWFVLAALLLPNIVTLAVIVVRELRFEPRFFVFAMPIFYIGIASGFQAAGEFGAKRLGRLGRVGRLGMSPGVWRVCGVGFIVLVAAATAVPLKSYYSMPKQDFRGGIARAVELRDGKGTIIAVYLADWGFKMYAEEYGLRQDEDYFFARGVEEMERVVEMHPGEDVYLVSTLHGPLEKRHPEVLAYVRDGWEVDHVFQGSLGGGSVAVWKPKE